MGVPPLPLVAWYSASARLNPSNMARAMKPVVLCLWRRGRWLLCEVDAPEAEVAHRLAASRSLAVTVNIRRSIARTQCGQEVCMILVSVDMRVVLRFIFV